ncbi:hypothetical protein MTO96_045756 [Rhipicephalus appendiculatus]
MTLPVITYVPAPDDSIRGVVYKAYTDESDEYLQAELTKKNSDIPIVNARRLGSSRHLVITFAGHTLPATIRFRCFTLEVHPFRERPEACFNCRKLGHRTDVCPLPGTLEYQNAEDAEENISRRPWEKSRRAPHSV